VDGRGHHRFRVPGRRLALGVASTVVGVVVLAAAHAAPGPLMSAADRRPRVVPTFAPTAAMDPDVYRTAASACPGLPWTVLAAIGQLESSHGQVVQVSSAGAVGPMQFLPATWEAYSTDGDADGVVSVGDPADAAASAARYLCANGGGSHTQLATAIWNYNHSWPYVTRVLSLSAAMGAD
jgi:transglycosylase-like protein with SLT domain